MADYQLSYDVWLAQQVERVKGVLLQNMGHTTTYTGAQLKTLAQDLGLFYTDDEYVDILGELITDGFLSQV